MECASSQRCTSNKYRTLFVNKWMCSLDRKIGWVLRATIITSVDTTHNAAQCRLSKWVYFFLFFFGFVFPFIVCRSFICLYRLFACCYRCCYFYCQCYFYCYSFASFSKCKSLETKTIVQCVRVCVRALQAMGSCCIVNKVYIYK